MAEHAAANAIYELICGASLHDANESDIIRARGQMLPVKPSPLLLVAALAWLVAAPLSADDSPQPPGIASPATVAASPPAFGTPGPDSRATRNQKKLLHTMLVLEKRYGKDAVLLESYALGAALRNGSILAAEVNLPGYEERKDQRFLEVRLATGIVFNDHDYSATQRPMRVWTNIIEPSLRQFESLTIAAEGVLFRVTYAHKAYNDESELRAQLKDGRSDKETAAFYILVSDVAEMLSQKISGQQLLDRSTVLVNGTEAQLILEPTPPPPQLPPS